MTSFFAGKVIHVKDDDTPVIVDNFVEMGDFSKFSLANDNEFHLKNERIMIEK